MGTFQDAIKDQFYGMGYNMLTPKSRVCLLDASGAPAGSDSIDRISAMVFTDDDMVDMGLPSGTLWCKKNVGATTETDGGWYFSWGNLEPHEKGAGYDFDQANYGASPAASVGGNLTLAQDAAKANKLGMWRMPNKEEFTELVNSDYTDIIDANGNVITGTDKRTTYNGVVGLLLRSKANGNTLFFPATGRYNGTTQQFYGTGCYLWLSTVGRYGGFNDIGAICNDSHNKWLGMTIRPVIHK